MIQQESFDFLEAVVHDNNASVELSEAHGIMTGMLCVSDEVSADAWFSLIFEQQGQLESLPDDARDTLEQLFAHTREALQAEVSDFQLMIPDDDSPLLDRVESLGEWCQGVVFGLGAVSAVDDWQDESFELMQDLLEISKIEAEVGDEEGEAAFMEVYEYVRVAVQLLFANRRSSPGSDDYTDMGELQ